MLLRILLLIFLTAPAYADADRGEIAVSEITPSVTTYFHRGWYVDVVECFDSNVARINKGPNPSQWVVIFDDRVDHLAFENRASGEIIVCSREAND